MVYRTGSDRDCFLVHVPNGGRRVVAEPLRGAQVYDSHQLKRLGKQQSVVGELVLEPCATAGAPTGRGPRVEQVNPGAPVSIGSVNPDAPVAPTAATAVPMGHGAIERNRPELPQAGAAEELKLPQAEAAEAAEEPKLLQPELPQADDAEAAEAAEEPKLPQAEAVEESKLPQPKRSNGTSRSCRKPKLQKSQTRSKLPRQQSEESAGAAEEPKLQKSRRIESAEAVEEPEMQTAPATVAQAAPDPACEGEGTAAAHRSLEDLRAIPLGELCGEMPLCFLPWLVWGKYTESSRRSSRCNKWSAQQFAEKIAQVWGVDPDIVEPFYEPTYQRISAEHPEIFGPRPKPIQSSQRSLEDVAEALVGSSHPLQFSKKIHKVMESEGET